MDKPGPFITSFNSGEIDPRTIARSELKSAYSGASFMRNVEPVPQGGFRLAPRTSDIGAVRFALTAMAATVTLAPGAVAGVATLATVDLGAAQFVAALDVAGFSSTVERLGGVTVEYQDPFGIWRPFAAPLTIKPVARTRRAAREPGEAIVARYLRLVWQGGAATLAIAGVTALAESLAATGQVRVRPFTYSSSVAYQAVITPAGIDFWCDGSWRGAVSLPYSTADFDALGHPTQSGDTMILWHPAHAPQRILSFGDYDWARDLVPWTGVPDVDYGGTYTKTPEVWRLYLRYLSSGGGADLAFTLTADGETTTEILTGAGPVTWATVAASIASALIALPSIETGVTVTQTSTTGLTTFTITFGGANAGQEIGLSATVVNTSEAAATVGRVTQGDPGGEPIMSSTRGWPIGGCFFQDRLGMCGFPANEAAFLLSQTGEYFQLDTDIEAASGPVLVRPKTEAAERLHAMREARHLVLFTDVAEYFISDRAITRTQIPNVVQSSRYGSSARVPIFEHDGALYFLSRSGSILYSAAYSDVSQKYDATPESLLASHLIEGIRDAAVQKGDKATDGARYMMVRDDGLMVLAILLQGQEVAAFTRWQTDGNVRSVCVDGTNAAWLVIERQIGASQQARLEKLDDTAILDQSITRTLATPSTVVDSLGPLNGRLVWAIADGWVIDPQVVTLGQITLPFPATVVTVGTWTAPIVRTLPLVRDVGPRIVQRRPARVYKVRASLLGTTSIAIGANGGPARDVPLWRAGDPVDVPLAPVSREIQVSGLTGWSVDGIVEITQVRPGALDVRDLNIQARL